VFDQVYTDQQLTLGRYPRLIIFATVSLTAESGCSESRRPAARAAPLALGLLAAQAPASAGAAATSSAGGLIPVFDEVVEGSKPLAKDSRSWPRQRMDGSLQQDPMADRIQTTARLPATTHLVPLVTRCARVQLPAPQRLSDGAGAPPGPFESRYFRQPTSRHAGHHSEPLTRAQPPVTVRSSLSR
jgi:hypothetical protein